MKVNIFHVWSINQTSLELVKFQCSTQVRIETYLTCHQCVLICGKNAQTVTKLVWVQYPLILHLTFTFTFIKMSMSPGSLWQAVNGILVEFWKCDHSVNNVVSSIFHENDIENNDIYCFITAVRKSSWNLTLSTVMSMNIGQ